MYTKPFCNAMICWLAAQLVKLLIGEPIGNKLLYGKQ